ncbi:TlpA family protein disulfide reductase [Pseudonocardia nigra]|uniref:TlpA family protein disulfide reductase n=1 Tax=Pseudonocardia nigra TaxID=1921578 RepID=UPI001C5E6BC1|nr:redoxin family protein [Pseudonocardia nigra]
MSQTKTGRSPSPRRSRRRWPLLAGIGVAVIAVLAVAYTALSPAPTPTPGAAASSSTGVAFTATTLSGQQVNVPGGKPSVVFFFSVNCGTCGPGAQALAQAQQSAPDANYVAVDVAPDETATDVAEFLTTNQATGLAYTLDTGGALTSSYQLTQLSTAVVLDAQGNTVYRGVDPTPDQIQAALATAGAR